MPIGKGKEWMLPGTFLAFLTLTGASVGAWVDIKTDVATNETKIERDSEQDKERYESLESKIDQILTHVLKNKSSDHDHNE